MVKRQKTKGKSTSSNTIIIPAATDPITMDIQIKQTLFSPSVMPNDIRELREKESINGVQIVKQELDNKVEIKTINHKRQKLSKRSSSKEKHKVHDSEDLILQTRKGWANWNNIITDQMLPHFDLVEYDFLKKALDAEIGFSWVVIAFCESYYCLSYFIKLKLPKKKYKDIDDKERDLQQILKELWPDTESKLDFNEDDLFNVDKIVKKIMADNWNLAPITIHRYLKKAKPVAKYLKSRLEHSDIEEYYLENFNYSVNIRELLSFPFSQQ